MRPLETLDTFWDLAHLDTPILTHDDLRRFQPPLRDTLLDAELLKPTCTATSVECDGCGEGHTGEVTCFTYPDGQTRLFMVCPECGRVPVHPDRLRQWAPDYSLVADLIADALQAKGAPQQIVPGRLWDLGRATLAGQTRPVWLIRRLDAAVRQQLPSDKHLVVFILGIRLRAEMDMDEDHVFEVRHLVRIVDGKLSLDVDAVRGQLGETVGAAPGTMLRPRYLLRQGSGVWQFTVDGLDGTIADERGLRYVEYLLKNPPPTPIHAVQLQAEVWEVRPDNDGLTEITDPDTEERIVLSRSARIQERNLSIDDRAANRRVWQVRVRLAAIAEDYSVTETERNEARAQVEDIDSILAGSALRGRSNAAKSYDRIRQAIKRLLEHLDAMATKDGDPVPAYAAFASHIRQHLLGASRRYSGTRTSRTRTGTAQTFAYERPDGVVWSD